MKTLNIFYLVIYWTQKVQKDFIFLCSIVLPCHLSATFQTISIIVVNLQDNRAVFRIVIALLRFSFDPPSYNLQKYYTDKSNELLEELLSESFVP